MTAITRKSSNYSKRLKRAEKKKVGHRQGRIIDLDGFLVFPEEMKKIRKTSKLPARAVESVGESTVQPTFAPIVQPWEREQAEREAAYDFAGITHDALMAKKLCGVVRPAAVKVRVGLVYKHGCNSKPKLAHCHCEKGDAKYGRICVSPAFFELDDEKRLWVLIHEILHFKFGRRHGRKFWELQNTFVPIDAWNALCLSGNARARELSK